jgi:hypothetical protein
MAYATAAGGGGGGGALDVTGTAGGLRRLRQPATAAGAGVG